MSIWKLGGSANNAIYGNNGVETAVMPNPYEITLKRYTPRSLLRMAPCGPNASTRLIGKSLTAPVA